MDVTCPRCQTDYEFDDALVSERGTTVKCTNCGHQFRVFRPRASSGPTPTPELWRIERRSGEPLELRSLVELQRAIRAGRVSREDLLRRGEAAPRRVGDIPELEPFFPAVRAEPSNTLPLPAVEPPRDDRAPAHTPAYGRQAAASAKNEPQDATRRVTTQRNLPTPAMTVPGVQAAKAPSQPPPPRQHTPLGIAAYQPPPGPDLGAPGRPASTLPFGPAYSGPVSPPPPISPLATPTPSSHVEPVPPSQARIAEPAAPSPKPADVAQASYPAALPRESEPPHPRESEPPGYDSLFPPRPPTRRRTGAAVLLVVLLGGAVVLLGATVGRPWIDRLRGRAPAAAGASGSATERLDRELAMGDRARGEGDFATAREAYLRATVIDDRSIGAWDGLCTVETELAMSHWIAGLASAGATELGQAANDGGAAGRSCGRWGELARGTQEGRARVDADVRPARALAAQGDGAGVRLFLPAHPGDPLLEALVVLADATKKDEAAVTEAARAAAAPLAKLPLTTTPLASDVALAAYCAAAANDAKRLDEALGELGRRAPKLAVLETLKALAPAAPTDAGTVDAASDAAADARDAAEAAPIDAIAPADEALGDWRSLDERGYRALGSGETARAEKMFRAALEQHPGDIDALFGLGQVAQARGETANATSYYKQVLDQSPGFAPARLALADVQWGAGQQADAVRNYEAYLDRNSEGAGADRARTRVASVKGGGETKPEPTATATTTTPPVAPSAPPAPTASGTP